MASLAFEPLQQTPPAADRTESAVDAIRREFGAAKPKASLHFDLPIPGRNLQMRFAGFDEKLYDELTDSTDDDKHLDFIAAACQCILVPDGDDWRPASNPDGSLVRFDGSLGDAAGWDISSPRQEVLRAFENVPMPRSSIRGHALLVDRWLNGLVEQREEETLGES